MKKLAILTIAAASLAALPAVAQPYYAGPADHGQYRGTNLAPRADHDGLTTGSIRPAPGADIAPPQERFSLNPAADGNASMQTRQAPNYGGVSGGYEAAD